MLFKYNLDNSELTTFKKHAIHYLSNIDVLKIKCIEFRLKLGAFEIITQAWRYPDCVWIQYRLEDNGQSVTPLHDARLCKLKTICYLFPSETVWGCFRMQDPQHTTNMLCKLVDVLNKLNGLKSFW